MPIRLTLSLLFFALTAQAQVPAAAAPEPTVLDILAALDRAPADPARLGAARTTLAAPLPTGLDNKDLADVHLKRANAANELGLVGTQIVELRRTIELGGGSQITRVWAELSLAEQSGGNFRNAIEASKNALGAANSGNSHGAMMGQNARLAHLYIQLGDLQTARSHLTEAQTRLEELKSTQKFARAWGFYRYLWSGLLESGLGYMEFVAGRFVEAEAHFRRALEFSEKDIPLGVDRMARQLPFVQSETTMANNRDFRERSLVGTLVEQDRLREAEYHARTVAYRAIERSGQDSIHAILTLAPLIQVLSAQGRAEQALQLIDRGQRKLDALGIPATALPYVVMRRQKARVLAQLGRWKEALGEYEAMQAALATDPQLADALGAPDVGWIRALIETGQAAKAVILASKLEAQMRERMGPQAYQVAEVRGFLGVALSTLKRDGEALAALREAIAVMIPAGSGQIDRSGARFRRFSYVIQAYLGVLSRVRGTAIEKSSGVDAATEAFIVADALRGRSVQQAMLASSLRAAAGTPQLADLVRQEQDSGQERDALYKVLADLMTRPTEQLLPQVIASAKARAAELEIRIKRLQGDIRERFPNFADLASPRPASVKDIQAVLRPGEALVSVMASEQGTFIWAIPATGNVAFATSKLTQQEVAQLVGRLRAGVAPEDFDIQRLPEFDGQAAFKLYAELLEPVRGGWGSAKNIFVATGSALSQLPFALLLTAPPPAPAAGQGGVAYAKYAHWPWLIKDVAISQLPTASALTTLRQMKPGAADRDAFAGFGDPDFRGSNSVAGTRGLKMAVRAVAFSAQSMRRLRDTDGSFSYDRIEALPETRDEILELAKMLQANSERDVFLGRQASKANVLKSNLKNRKVLAFATHGLLRGEYPGVDQPALALANPGGGQHGLLTLDDILGLKLDADWVILSACNTAGGDGDAAEALSGLGRGFFYAGSRSLLVTHWPVESASAKSLVVGVFDVLSKSTGMPRAEALRQSMLTVMKAGGNEGGKGYSLAHPLFWAPYALVGDGGN